MAKAQIVIQNGVVVFSPELLQEFPEITATITGNVVTVSNAWREDLISVVGDNIFWAEKQDFLSFSIIFTDNKASVNSLDELIVRYVNFHEGDYLITVPAYTASVDLLRDPLSIGLKPNYFNSLQEYVDGLISLTDVAEVVASMYSAVSVETNFNAEQIEVILATIPMGDISTFLSADISAMDTYNVVANKDNLGDSGVGIKSYSLTTAGKELSFVEEEGAIEITKLCVKDGEDVTELVDKLIVNATVISQCVLKALTPTQFAQGVFTRITTDFGVHVDIKRTATTSAKIYYDNNDLVPDFSYVETISASLWGELLADLIEKSTALPITYFAVYGRRSTYGTFGTPRYPELGTYFVSTDSNSLSTGGIIGEAFSIAREKLVEKSVPMSIDYGNYADTVPINLLSGVKTGNSYNYPEQFFNAQDITKITGYGSSVPIFDNGVFSVSNSSDFGFMGTPLQSKVTQIIIRNQLEESVLIAQAIRLGFTDVKSGIQNFGCLGGIGFGFELKNYKQEIVNIIDAGLNQFDRLSPVSELEVSSRGIDIAVANITHGSLLICPFGEATQGSGYFESGVETPYLIEDIIESTNYYAVNLGRYKFAMSSITLNGVSIADKTQILEVLVGEQPITVACNYSLRSHDIALFTSIFESLRKGYKEVFRFGSTSDIIEVAEDYFSYSVLSKFYDVLIGGISITGGTVDSVMTAHHNLVSIAQGGSVSVSSVFDDMEDYQIRGALTTSSIDFSISLGGVVKEACTISSANPSVDNGHLTLTCDNSDTIDFAYGNIQDALVNATPNDPNNFSVIVLMHHTLIDNVLVVYYVQIGRSGGVQFTNVKHIAINIKTTKAIYSPQTPSSNNPQVPTDWGTIATVPTESSNVTSDGNYVHYTFVDNNDGSVTVSYTAFDKDGNDITDQFNTLSIGDYFLHKEVE
jgi:hypothetical protein